MDNLLEFDNQIKNLKEKGYPRGFIDQAIDLKELASKLPESEIDLDAGHLPFVIVVKRGSGPSEKLMDKVSRDGKQGFSKLFPHTSVDFSPIDSLSIPDKDVYLLVDIDRGNDSINIRPSDALNGIVSQGRSPLTIDEGIAIVTHHPEYLIKNKCFSLLGSRVKGNKRVPAIWINAEKRPNLGWCWNGNPHTWLGSASAQKRL